MEEDKKEEKEKKKVNYSKQGKLNRAAGQRFEAKVRANLEEMGWIVDKWMNTVDYNREGKTGKVVPAKRKYNPFKRVMVLGTGFPDFVCFKRVSSEEGEEEGKGYEIVGVEVKSKGYLDEIERDMCRWLIESKTFSRILIAKKGEKRGTIEYINFIDKYKKDFAEQ